MNFDNNFVSFEDWIDFVFESLTSKGIAVDEEIIKSDMLPVPFLVAGFSVALTERLQANEVLDKLLVNVLVTDVPLHIEDNTVSLVNKGVDKIV